MRQLDVTAYDSNGTVYTAEGSPDQLGFAQASARFFLMKYPNFQLRLWIIGDVRAEQAYAALRDILNVSHRALAT